MRKEEFLFNGAEGTELSAVVWMPENDIHGILQVVHGMTEHIGRYEKLAHVLTQEGIVVAGFDLRGHGKNSGDKKVASLGECGWKNSIEDIHLFHEYLQTRFQCDKHFLLGFSLGSFLVREYLAIHLDKIQGAIIMGTGYQPGVVLDVMKTIVKTQNKKAGFNHTTPLVKQLSFETYNKKFAPNRTTADWLCSDETQLDLYREDELCREDISSGLFYELLDGMKRTGMPDTYKKWNESTRILLMSGKEDPVGDMGKGVLRVYEDMKKAGLNSVEMHLLENARHDLLHEEESGNAEKAIKMIVEWVK